MKPISEETRRRQKLANDLADRLRHSLETENGLQAHPKRDLLWQLAWDRGHSAGLQEVEGEYNELAQLLK